MSSLKDKLLNIESVKENVTNMKNENAKEKQNCNGKLCTRCNTAHKNFECLSCKKQCFACGKEVHFSICCASKKKKKHVATVNSLFDEGSKNNKDSKSFVISRIAKNI